MEYLIGSIILSVALMGYAIWWDVYRQEKNRHPIIFNRDKYEKLKRQVNRQQRKVEEIIKKLEQTPVTQITIPASLANLNVYEHFSQTIAVERGLYFYEETDTLKSGKPVTHLVLCREMVDGSIEDVKKFTGNDQWTKAAKYLMAA
jgi:Txe/YoeB family toxin of Txe-Axe toxin-antitoxin module